MCFNNNRIYISSDFYYTFFRIKNRLIFAPCDGLKEQQRYFLNAIKRFYKPSPNTLKTSKIHVGKKWILKMDIKDFYYSVPTDDIEKFVNSVCEIYNKLSDYNYYFNLVTLKDKLPTGAPTSAHIANGCFEKVDKHIKRICRNYDVDYSRYMDDLTFSSNSKEILNKIEERVKNILSFHGYRINSKKTKYISDNKRQEILGIVVNGNKTRIPNYFKRRIRAMFYNFAKQKEGDLKYCVNSNQLIGYISYVKSVDKEFYMRLEKYLLKLELKF